ncbi:hypothetical protein Hanom_Chr17g01546291 [Helianthus anomalus]
MRTNSLTTVAGECMPKNGTISTCNQFSTTDPTTAPATRPPMVITVALPEDSQSLIKVKIHQRNVVLNFLLNDKSHPRVLIPSLTFRLVIKYNEAPKLVAKISPGTSAPEREPTGVDAPLT